VNQLLAIACLVLVLVCYPTNDEGDDENCDQCNIWQTGEHIYKHSGLHEWKCIANGKEVWKMFCPEGTK
jgi:hypothetical protein